MLKTNNNIRLSVFGCLRAVKETVKEAGETITEKVIQKFDLKNAVCDAGILSAITFFTGLAGLSIAQVDFTQALYGVSVATFLEFFTILGFKKGLIGQG